MTGYQMYVAGTGRRPQRAPVGPRARTRPDEWQPLRDDAAAGRGGRRRGDDDRTGGVRRHRAHRGRAARRATTSALDSDDAYASGRALVLGDAERRRPLAYVYYGALDRTGHDAGRGVPGVARRLRASRPVAAEIAAAPARRRRAARHRGPRHGRHRPRRRSIDVADEPVAAGRRAGAGRRGPLPLRPHRARRRPRRRWRSGATSSRTGSACCSRDETIDAGLLGPIVTAAAAERVGDVVVLARGAGAVFDRRVDAARVRNLVGQHGSLTVGRDVRAAAASPGAADRVANLLFFTGTMDSGKSTLALQMDHNHAVRGRVGRIFTSLDRAGSATLSSRLGLQVPAIEVPPDLDLWHYVVDELQRGARIDYLVCDEAQFYTAAQIDQLARIVDDLGIDVLAFGLLTDFRTRLFAGSARLVELADRTQPLQVEALCWCGARATHNARRSAASWWSRASRSSSATSAATTRPGWTT